jgi:hypothetical protein
VQGRKYALRLEGAGADSHVRKTRLSGLKIELLGIILASHGHPN